MQQPTEMPIDIDLPPDLMGAQSKMDIDLPPELTAQPPQPTTTIDQQRQAIFNAELKTEMGRSMAAQEKGDEEGTNRAVRSLNSLLMEAARAKIPLSY
jgi:hypothetical protein